ncbi:MAG: esterase, partial [Deltaproteobacteria bacterium]|nr:esterase [Deltaproteobacteria bacterium]
MTRPAPDPFLLPGGPVGVLLIHGFTGAPAEMRPIAEPLHAAGCTVSGPLLPGHGTRWQDMNRCRWQAWADHAEAALA